MRIILPLLLAAGSLAQCPQPMPGTLDNRAEDRWVLKGNTSRASTSRTAVQPSDPAFDCKMRQLALEFSIASRGNQGASVVAQALNLTDSGECSPGKLESNSEAAWLNHAAAGRVLKARPGLKDMNDLESNSVSVYVSTTGNDKTGDGSKASPFASLARAVEEVSSAKVRAARAAAGGPTEIMMEPGTYYAPDVGTIIGPEASGLNAGSPLRIMPSTSEGEVVLSGGAYLGKLPWTQAEKGFRSFSGRVNVPIARALLAAMDLPELSAQSTPEMARQVASAARALQSWQETSLPAAARRALPIDHTMYGNLLRRRPEGEVPGAEGARALGLAVDAAACESLCQASGPTGCRSYSHVAFTTISQAVASFGAYADLHSALLDASRGGTAAGVCIGRSDGVWSPYATPADLLGLTHDDEASHDVSGIYVDIYVADVAPLKSGKSISGLYFDGIGAGNRGTVARFPNGNDTQPMPLGWIQADGGWPDVPQDGAGTGKSFAYNTKVTSKATGEQLSQGYIAGRSSSQTIAVDAPATEPHATYAKGSCREFMALEGGTLDRFNSTYNYPFWNSAVCEGMHFDKSSFTPRSWAAWPESEQPRVHMRQMHTWGSWGMLIASRTDSNTSMVFATQANQEARGGGINKVGSGHGPEGGGNPFYVERVREELDAPGEFYHDIAAKKLYFYPMPGQNIMESEFVAPDAEEVVTMQGRYAASSSSSGGSDDPVRFVELHNLTIAHSRVTYFSDFETPPGGDWAIHRGAMLFIDGAENVTVSNSRLQSPSGNGLMLSRKVRGTVVIGCEVADAGETGIAVLGASDGMDAFTRQWQPTGNQIVANHVHHVGRLGKQAAPIFEGVAGHNEYAYNTLHDGPRAGYNGNPGLGGSQLRSNLIFNMVSQTWDHGPTNEWGRQDWLHAADTGNDAGLNLYPAQQVFSGNMILNRNYGLGHPNSDKCIDLDDGTSDVSVHQNVAVYGGQKFRDGRFRTVKNNLFLYAETHNADFSVEPGLFLGPMSQSVHAHYTRSSDVFENNTLVARGGAFVACSSGWTQDNFPAVDYNTYLTPNMSSKPFSSSGCCKDCGSWEGWQAQGHDKHSTRSSDVSLGQLVSMAERVLGL